MPRLESVNTIINDAAVECGLNPDNNPVASTEETFVQLKNMLNTAGRQLVKLHDWQILEKEYAFTTQQGDSGDYDLPDDFDHMIDQSGWDQSNRVAIGGPLSTQDWSYLEGRDLVSQSIYASFQLNDNKLRLYPQPPPVGLNISFKYCSRNWLAEQGDFNQRRDRVDTGTDTCLFDPVMMMLYLKARFLAAKGFDASDAKLEFENMFNALTGQDEGAPILSASNNSRGFPFLHPYYNTGDTGFGVP